MLSKVLTSQDTRFATIFLHFNPKYVGYATLTLGKVNLKIDAFDSTSDNVKR